MALLKDEFNEKYMVPELYKPFWNFLRRTHQLVPMKVFDVDDTIIADPELFKQKLVGTLVEVTFTLHHWYISGTNSKPSKNDTFSARVLSVSILEPPPVVLASPYKETIFTRKAKPVPPTRSEHLNAAKAFGPQDLTPIPQPNFVEGSSGASASSSNTIADDVDRLTRSHVQGSAYSCFWCIVILLNATFTGEDGDDEDNETANLESPTKKSRSK